MTAKLLIREVGQREFVQHNGDFVASDEIPGAEGSEYIPPRTDIENATMAGEKLCANGNVEAFQVWSLVAAKQRVWKLEEIEG